MEPRRRSRFDASLPRDPARKVETSPKAVDLAEAGSPEHVLVHLGGHRDQDALEGQALALDLEVRVSVRALLRVVLLDERRVDVRGRADHLLDEDEGAARPEHPVDVAKDAKAMLERHELKREDREHDRRAAAGAA